MKKVLGLDLGTNSIGWAVIDTKQNENGEEVFDKIACADSRIIPMDQATIGDFNRGNSKSQTAERTRCRGVRRLYERGHLRRERLNRVLSVLGWLPDNYLKSLDRYGKFIAGSEPKLAWRKNSEGKYEFLFEKAFQEMLEDFKSTKQQVVTDGKKVPYDWTIYYLRKKALTERLSNFELAWVLLNFNQKRGYYQLRGEDEEEKSGKIEEYYSLKVVEIEDTGERKGSDTWFNIVLENGFVYRRPFHEAPDWIGKVKDFIVTTDVDVNGNPKMDKEGQVKRSFRMPKEDDWTLLKKKTECDIDNSRKTVGEYIYDVLLHNPESKVRGRLVRTVERKYYRRELELILDRQVALNPDLKDEELYSKCIEALYPSNDAYRNSISGRGFKYLFVNDIIFYQRPLKSKKSLIDDCPLEERYYVLPNTGERKVEHIKCIAKSNPYFQEFRLWQFLSNLKIIERERVADGSIKENIDVTSNFIDGDESLADLFAWINDRESIDQKSLLAYPGFKLNKADQKRYRWNYVEDKSYPANETRAGLLLALDKADVSREFLTSEREYELWHVLYSVEDKNEIRKALSSFAKRYGLQGDFVNIFAKMKPYEKEYGSYSEKAIKRMLPLMRAGRYWKEDNIDEATRCRISRLLSGEFDENIHNRVREKTIALQSMHDFQGLPVWLVCYVVYDRHSEAKDIDKWSCPEDIDAYLAKFRQHSLRNPIVESVVMETLRTVRDIWKAEGRIDEIHIELGREMKNPADKRKRITEQALENENANLRVRAMLTEFMNPEFNVDNVRPYSPGQQEILRIYEDSALGDGQDIPDDIKSILDKFNKQEPLKRPTSSEVLRYKVWLEQKYRSPYTGEIIPLGKLFTPAYEIEHIIPQSLYFDDSFSNKVICESEVNKLKDKSLGYQFIKEHQGEIVTLSGGRQVKILSVEAYEKFVRDHYSEKKNVAKKRNLLAEDIPESFIHRQLNDSRYISKVVKTLLSNVVREKDEEQDISKNVITCNGQITTRLKMDWGINDLWKQIMLPRFERLDGMSQDESFVAVNANGQKVPVVPFYRQKGFEMKRIDHRHHAMDAIVIACATRNIVNYLNNSSACRDSKEKRYDLQRVVCEKVHPDSSGNYSWVIKMPSDYFVDEVHSALTRCIVSFKQNLRIINKSSNYYEKIEKGEKVRVRQEKGDNWAIRKSMHKDTVFGEVNLRKIKSVSLNEALKNPGRIVRKDIKKLVCPCSDIKAMKMLLTKHFPELTKLDIYYYTSETNDKYFATRTTISPDFTKEFIQKSVTDTGIQNILLKHLDQCGNKPDVAFSPDGIDKMNANIIELNGGRPHKPIFSIRKYEKGDKFPVGEIGCKTKKFVEAAKGTNLFFGVYISSEGKRSYFSAPLNEVIAREKAGLSPVPEKNGEDRLLFWLSPNDLVYVPTEDELERGYVDGELDRGRIYKMVSCTGKECHFIPATVAKSIVDKIEFSPLNKMARAISGEMIKEICIPIKVDRLGRIVKFNGKLR